jgi:hypothetical protein
MRHGWFRESYRHSLAARGIKADRFVSKKVVEKLMKNMQFPAGLTIKGKTEAGMVMTPFGEIPTAEARVVLPRTNMEEPITPTIPTMTEVRKGFQYTTPEGEIKIVENPEQLATMQLEFMPRTAEEAIGYLRGKPTWSNEVYRINLKKISGDQLKQIQIVRSDESKIVADMISKGSARESVEQELSKLGYSKTKIQQAFRDYDNEIKGIVKAHVIEYKDYNLPKQTEMVQTVIRVPNKSIGALNINAGQATRDQITDAVEQKMEFYGGRVAFVKGKHLGVDFGTGAYLYIPEGYGEPGYKAGEDALTVPSMLKVDSNGNIELQPMPKYAKRVDMVEQDVTIRNFRNTMNAVPAKDKAAVLLSLANDIVSKKNYESIIGQETAKRLQPSLMNVPEEWQQDVMMGKFQEALGDINVSPATKEWMAKNIKDIGGYRAIRGAIEMEKGKEIAALVARAQEYPGTLRFPAGEILKAPKEYTTVYGEELRNVPEEGFETFKPSTYKEFKKALEANPEYLRKAMEGLPEVVVLPERRPLTFPSFEQPVYGAVAPDIVEPVFKFMKHPQTGEYKKVIVRESPLISWNKSPSKFNPSEAEMKAARKAVKEETERASKALSERVAASIAGLPSTGIKVTMVESKEPMFFSLPKQTPMDIAYKYKYEGVPEQELERMFREKPELRSMPTMEPVRVPRRDVIWKPSMQTTSISETGAQEVANVLSKLGNAPITKEAIQKRIQQKFGEQQ